MTYPQIGWSGSKASEQVLFGELLWLLAGLMLIACVPENTPRENTNGGASQAGSDSGGSAIAGTAGTSNSGAAGTVDKPDASAGKDAEPDVPADVDLPDLTVGLPGPRMTRVRTPDGHSYYIDSTEVTQAQYQEFVSAAKATGYKPEQPEFCSQNPSFEPPTFGSKPGDPDYHCPEGYVRPTETPDVPMVCVDWCDADAYCKWAGKRLCGRVGGGVLKTLEDAKNADVDEWYNACSNGGKTKYPYGDTFEKEKCNTNTPSDVPAEGQAGLLRAADQVPDCRGIAPHLTRFSICRAMCMNGKIGAHSYPQGRIRMCVPSEGITSCTTQ